MRRSLLAYAGGDQFALKHEVTLEQVRSLLK
jgi:hypothetical protein